MKALLPPLFLSGFVLMLLAASASSAVVVTQSASAPTANILRAAADDSLGLVNWNGYGNPETATAGWRDVGQTFQSNSDGTLTAFTYKLSSYEAQALGAAFTVKIYESTTAQTPFSSATLLSEQAGFLPVTLEKNQYIAFKLDDAVDLKANLFYTVYLHFDTPGTSTTVGNRRQLVFTSANYTASENPLGVGSYVWLRQNPFDTAARANYTLTAYFEGTAIPEPQTAPLAIGAAGILWIGRKLTRISSNSCRE